METLTDEPTELTTEQEQEGFLQLVGVRSKEKMGDFGKIIPEPKVEREEAVETDVKKKDDEKPKETELKEPSKKEEAKPEETAFEKDKPKSKSKRDEEERQRHVLANFSKKQDEFKAEQDKFAEEKANFEQTQKLFTQELETLRRFKREVDHSIEKGGKYMRLDPDVFRAQAQKFQDEAEQALAEDDSERAKQLFAQAKQELKNADAIEATAKEFIEKDKQDYQAKIQTKQTALQQVFKDFPALLENNGKNPLYQISDAILKGQQIKLADKTLDTSHLGAWLSSLENPNGYHYAARLAELIHFKNTAQADLDRLSKENETLKKEKDELVAKINVGGSYAHGGKSEKEFSKLSGKEQEAEEKKLFEATFGSKFD